MDELSEGKVFQILDWAYNSAINGLPKTLSAYEMADSYMRKSSSLEDAIDSLIKWQQAKCATSGFVTGLGGINTLPVAVPTNLASVLYVQIRMIASIAHMRGYDLKDDQVQTFVYSCLTGRSVAEIVKQGAIKIGVKVGQAQIKRIPSEILKAINKAVGFRLITKFGQKGVLNLGKAVPLIGGVIGGTFDATSTYVIGKLAKETFREDGYNNGDGMIVGIQ
ncbi:EcsC family protein [Lysinibacillus sp. NPDC094403]|uniref:EcsC family protein n=1 Tax=Lysinibacillus sp. NPDC094403 TaxID=3390581 RepID=UPI003D0799E9